MKNQELINDYLDYLKYERKLSDNTYDSYAQNLKNLLEHPSFVLVKIKKV